MGTSGSVGITKGTFTRKMELPIGESGESPITEEGTGKEVTGSGRGFPEHVGLMEGKTKEKAEEFVIRSDEKGVIGSSSTPAKKTM